MTQTTNGYINSRVLKLNVGFLLNVGPGNSNDSVLDLPAVRVSEDLLLKYVRGPLRLSRTKEGVLVQATLETAVEDECFRCLDPIEHLMTVQLEELYTYQADFLSEFRIGEDAILDLAPLLRAEVLIEESHRMLCKPDCAGLCPECGINRNHGACNCDHETLDPRFAVLKQLLNTK